MKIFNLKLSDETHQQLKVKAAISGVTIKELLISLVNDYLGEGREG